MGHTLIARTAARLRRWPFWQRSLLCAFIGFGCGALWLFVFKPYRETRAAQDALSDVGATVVTTNAAPDAWPFPASTGLLERIVELQLQGRPLSDIDESHFGRGLRGVERLYLFDTPLSEDDAPLISKLPQLHILSVTNGHIAPAVLRQLPKLPSLQRVYLNGAGIVDEDLSYLGRIPGLKELGITGSSVTDAGLQFLKHANSLVRVNLAHTHVTDRGVEELQRALPGCTVFYK